MKKVNKSIKSDLKPNHGINPLKKISLSLFFFNSVKTFLLINTKSEVCSFIFMFESELKNL